LKAAPWNTRRSRRLEGVALILISLSAILFQRSATSTWVEAHAANGHRMLVSPIGVQDWGPDTADRPLSECRWWPKLGDQALCELVPNGEAAMSRLRRAYPFAVVSLWMSVLALFLVALRIPRIPRAVGVVVTAAVPVLAVSALYFLATSATLALRVLAHADVRVERGGFVGVSGGALLMTIAVGLLLISRMKARPPETRPF
jgi:hypothetical protein